MKLRRLIVLNLCLPLVLSLYYSLARSTSVPDPNTFSVFAVYCLSSVPMYVFAQLGSILLRVGLPNRWAILAVIGGGAISVLLGYFYLNLLVLGIEKHSEWLRSGLTMQYDTFEPFVDYVLSGATLLFPVIWLLANLIYEMATREFFFFNLRSRSLGHTGDTESNPTAPLAQSDISHGLIGFLSKLDGEFHHRLVAIEAQEHYVRAHSEDGKSQLVLYRFGDAVEELEASGHALQVHRSYCVNIEAIEEVRKSGRAQTIVLRGGMEIPVSQSYRSIVSKLGHVRAS